jgi:hypothetical protein
VQFHQESSGVAPPVEVLHSKQRKVLPRVNHRYTFRCRFCEANLEVSPSLLERLSLNRSPYQAFAGFHH